VLSALGSAIGATNGYLFNLGALDFAGGTVVHVNAGVAGLVCALVLGPRVGFGREPMAPHNLALTFIGACLLWVGWYGFNAGSNLEANGLTALVVLNTTIATAAAALAWSLGEYLTRGHASLLGAASGAVAGLVGITACGWPPRRRHRGDRCRPLCLWAVVSKRRLADDASTSRRHGIGGMVGALLTGIFVNPALGGVGVTDHSPATPEQARAL
jgi:Amt family ammonium transporter